MKIAAITITMNDYHNLESWKRYYEGYQSAIYKHIIVDNNSEPAYKAELKTLFPHTVLIERSENGGTTGAYNDGIRYALNELDGVDAILLTANDILISAESIKAMYDFLFAKQSVGAVGPVLLDRDHKTIVTYGEELDDYLGLKRLYEGEEMSSNLPATVKSACLPGGINLIKAEVYRKVGYQDESLFMYMDENDYFLRVTQFGYEIYAIRAALASHCHIITEGRTNDSGLAWFYINRNQLLVCRQYLSLGKPLKLFTKKFFFTGPKYIVTFLREGAWKKIYHYYLGLICGIIGYRKNIVQKR